MVTGRSRSGRFIGSEGLTIIEVLVAMVLLSIVGAAIVGMFTMMGRLVQDSSVDVDLARVVRTVGDGIWDDWRILAEWNAGTVGGFELSEFVRVESDNRCEGRWSAPDIPEVRIVRIECGEDGSPAHQVYEFEVGSPGV